MPGGKGPGPSIKNAKQYESLKRKFMKEGLSEEAAQTKAAKISNASASMNKFMRSKRR